MKGFSLALLGLIACLTFPNASIACEKFQTKVDRYSQLKRQGGSAKQMSKWSAQRAIYADRYRECVNALPTVHRFSQNKKQRKLKTVRQPLRKVESNDPLVLKLLATCNYWINTYNQRPIPTHQTYKETACRALDDAQTSSPDLAAAPKHQRSLKECMKPDNLLDEEVYQCLIGAREPDWQ